MFKALTLTVAAGAIAALAAVDAGALSVAPTQPVVENGVTLVADGCGRGFRFSYRLRRCVPMGGGVVVAPPVIVAPPVMAPVVCGPGRRWNARWRRCVFM